MAYFARTQNTLTGLLIILICGMAACGGTQSSPGSATGSDVKTRGDLLQMPPALSGRNPVEQGLAYLDVVNEMQAETSNPQERHFRVKTGSIFSARGWAFDDKRMTAPPVWLELAGRSGANRVFVPTTRGASKELSVGFHYPWAAMANFIALVEQANIPPDTYEVTVFQADSDGLVKTPFYSVQRITIEVE
jgi:hypothetical protein